MNVSPPKRRSKPKSNLKPWYQRLSKSHIDNSGDSGCSTIETLSGDSSCESRYATTNVVESAQVPSLCRQHENSEESSNNEATITYELNSGDSGCATIGELSDSCESRDATTNAVEYAQVQVASLCRQHEKLKESSNDETKTICKLAHPVDKVGNSLKQVRFLRICSQFFIQVREIQNEFNCQISRVYRKHGVQWLKIRDAVRLLWTRILTVYSNQHRSCIYEYFSRLVESCTTIHKDQKVPYQFLNDDWIQKKQMNYKVLNQTYLFDFNKELDEVFRVLDVKMLAIGRGFHGELTSAQLQFEKRIPEFGSDVKTIENLVTEHYELLRQWASAYGLKYRDAMSDIVSWFRRRMLETDAKFRARFESASKDYVSEIETACSEIVTANPTDVMLLQHIRLEEERMYYVHSGVSLSEVEMLQDKGMEKASGELSNDVQEIFFFMNEEIRARCYKLNELITKLYR